VPVALLSEVIGRVYLERGEPVRVLARWRDVEPVEVRGRVLRTPRNVLIERADGSRVVRPFRGLRRVRSTR
jgi:acetyl esterase